MRYVTKIKYVGLSLLLILFASAGIFSAKTQTQEFLFEKQSLSLELARKIAVSCEAKAKELGFSVGIVILDEVGNLKLAYLMDGQSITSLEWAKAKALSSFEFKQSTTKGEFRVWNIGDKTMVLGVSGGEPLVYEKSLLGAIGVSGTKGKEDDVIVSAGIETFNEIFKSQNRSRSKK